MDTGGCFPWVKQKGEGEADHSPLSGAAVKKIMHSQNITVLPFSIAKY
jgi:hypothetical protein